MKTHLGVLLIWACLTAMACQQALAYTPKTGACNFDYGEFRNFKSDTDAQGAWHLRKDGVPLVTEKCCPQSVSFVFRDCRNYGLNHVLTNGNVQCAVIRVNNAIVHPKDNWISHYNPVHCDERKDAAEFIWYIEELQGNTWWSKYRIFRFHNDGRILYLGSSLSANKNQVHLTPFAFLWYGKYNSGVSASTNPCKWD